MKNTIATIVAGALLVASNLSAQSAGSVALIGVNDGPYVSDSGLAFVALDAIAPGQELHFTTQGWNGTSFYNSGEGTMSYTSNVGLAAGSVVVLGFDEDGEWMVLSGGGELSYNGDGLDLYLPYESNQWLVYTGASESPNFLFGASLSEYGWETDSDNGTRPETALSAEPASIVGASVELAGSDAGFGYHGGNWAYTGPTSGTAGDLLNNITNPSNWFNWAADDGFTRAPLDGFGDFNVIPEPSTYAAIAGALVLGLALYRRRRAV